MNKIREIIGKEYANTLGIIAYKNGEKVMEEYFEGVGFKIKFKDVFSKAIKPIALGGSTWACVALSSLAFIFIFKGYVG